MIIHESPIDYRRSRTDVSGMVITPTSLTKNVRYRIIGSYKRMRRNGMTPQQARWSTFDLLFAAFLATDYNDHIQYIPTKKESK